MGRRKSVLSEIPSAPDFANVDEVVQNEEWNAEKFRQFRDTYELRRKYLQKAFLTVYVVLVIALVIVALTGWHCLDLPEGVVVTLLATTTANVIGLLCIAFKWLFPKQG